MAARSVAWDTGEPIPRTPFRHLIKAADTDGRFSAQSAVVPAGRLVIPHVEAIVLEFISPAGFEGFFEEMSALQEGAPPEAARGIATRYGQSPHPELIAELSELYGVSIWRLGNQRPTVPSRAAARRGCTLLGPAGPHEVSRTSTPADRW